MKNLFFSILFFLFSSMANAGVITTLYGSNNGGNNGGAVYFDLTVGSNDLLITGFDTNTGSLSVFNDFEVWLLTGLTSQGNETSASWVQVATGSGTGAGLDNATTVALSNSISLDANTLYGISLFSSLDHRYTNGDGSNQDYSNTDLSLFLGTASNAPFTPGFFNPRVWNGTVKYDVNASAIPEPTSLALLGLGLAGFGFSRKKKTS